MLSNTFNSHHGLGHSNCHFHFKEKHIETAERLTNLPKTPELVRIGVRIPAQVFWLTPSLLGDLKDAVYSPSLGGCWRALSSSCKWHGQRMGKCFRNCWGASEKLDSHAHLAKWADRLIDSLPCTSALPTVKLKTKIVATYPPACSQEWDKSSQRLCKKQFSFQPLRLLSSLKGSKSYKGWRSPLLSWT